MMKYIVSCFLIVGQILGTTVSYAALSDADRALVDTGKNLLKNPGFENSSSYWTASGGATTAANSTAKGTGALGYDWDSNSAAQTLLSSSVTIPAGLQGKNGVASCQIKTVSGTATHTLTVNDGTNDLATPLTIGSNTTSFQETKINFVFPTSGTIRLKLASVASNEPEVYIDDCKITLADNIYDVQQAKLIDVVTVTGCNTSWNTTSSSFASLSTATTCTYSSLNGVCGGPNGTNSSQTAGAKILCSSIPSGDLKIEYEGMVGSANTGSMNEQYEFYDGTNEFNERSSLEKTLAGVAVKIPSISGTRRYTSPQSNITFEIRGKNSVGNNASVYGTTANPGTFRVFYFPSASQQAVSSAQADYDWTSYTPTFTGFGTVTGVECQHSRVASNLHVRCKFTSGTVTATEARISLPNSLTSADTTKIPSIQIAGNGVVNSNGSVADGVGSTYAVLIEPSTSYITFGTRYSGVKPLDKLLGTGFVSSTVHSFSWSVPIQGWSSNQRAPTLVGSVTTDNDTPERICRATVTASCTSSPCTIANGNAGSCMTNITRSSAGVYTANFPSGKFSAVPSCFAWNYTTNRYMIGNGTGTATAFSFQTSDSADTGFTVMCMGPR